MNQSRKFCQNCGNPIQPGESFCGQCGEHILGNSVSEQKAILLSQNDLPPEVHQEKQKKPSMRSLILIIGILLLALGVAYAWYGKDISRFKEKIIKGKIIEKMVKDKSVEKAVGERPIEKVFRRKDLPPPERTLPVFDRLLLDKYVTTLRFFESGPGMLPFNERFYRNEFLSTATRFINWEIQLNHPPPDQRIDFRIDAVWHRFDGSVIIQETVPTYIEPYRNNSFYTFGRGNMNPGTWLVGDYSVEFYIEGKRIGYGAFRVY
jgi:hypothetical protein